MTFVIKHIMLDRNAINTKETSTLRVFRSCFQIKNGKKQGKISKKYTVPLCLDIYSPPSLYIPRKVYCSLIY